MEHKISFIFRNPQTNEDKIVSASQSDTLLEALLKSGVEIPHSCGAMGTCGTCRILVLNPNEQTLRRESELELEMAQDRGFAENEKLSCQNRVLANLVVSV